MTKKDFTLITDAINAAIGRLLEPGSNLREALDKLDPYIAGRAEDRIRFAFASEFASRLPYTSDGFDPERFKQSITMASKVVRDK